MRFYLGSRYSRREEMEGYARQIRAEGDEVTSRWHDGHQDPFKTSGESTPGNQRRFAAEDVYDLRRADLVVIFAGGSTRGGYHFESGLAFGLEKPMALVGEHENVFHHLLDHYDDWESLYRRIYLTRKLAALGVLVSA